MGNALRDNIKRNLALHKLSVAELERKAGLKTCAVRNILDGRSNNPNIETLRAIANQFGQGVDELISPEPPVTKKRAGTIIEKIGFDAKLLKNIQDDLIKTIQKENIQLTIKEFLIFTKQIYDYSVECKLSFVDKRFVKYVLREKLNEKI